jgi:hypothetical protein
VRLGNDVRRLPCHNADLTFDDLILMLQRVFADKLPTDDFVLKYQDEGTAAAGAKEATIPGFALGSLSPSPPQRKVVLLSDVADGDLVTIADNQDLHLATMNASVVRLTICSRCSGAGL